VSAMKKFQKGDILFARRNAYLKRASMVDFDGICSGDAFVIRDKQDKVVPGFLAFIFNSESLWHYANSYAAGSMSKRVKWRDLANYEFSLPPPEEQKRIADLLWSVDEAIEKYEDLLSQMLLVRISVLKNIYTVNGVKSASISDLPIKEINGMWKTEDKNDVMSASIIRSTEIQTYGEITYDTAQRHKVKTSQFQDKRLLNGDIIVERSGGGPDQPVGRVCYFDRTDGDYTFSNFTSVIRVVDKDKLIPKYLLNFLLFFYEMKGTDRLQKQTTGIRNLDYDLYRKIKIPFRCEKDQKKCVDICESLNNRRKDIIQQILINKNIQKQLINQIFG
jgi:type I restriction enzyme, S subunit